MTGSVLFPPVGAPVTSLNICSMILSMIVAIPLAMVGVAVVRSELQPTTEGH